MRFDVPPTLRFSKRLLFLIKKHNLLVMAFIFTTFVFFVSLFYWSGGSDSGFSYGSESSDQCFGKPYNSTYPLSNPVETSSWIQYDIAIVADSDTNSKKKNGWISSVWHGTLRYNSGKNKITVRWQSKQDLWTKWAIGDRGNELSALQAFNGKLYTVDDRTGIIYLLQDSSLHPWVILGDGPGLAEKGFKGEWMTVKDELLYVGSLGKEWTTITGEYVNDHPQWIKIIDRHGYVQHTNWTGNYNKMRADLGYSLPGYLLHESCQWSKYFRKWFFLPRRVSKEMYSEAVDETKGSNLLIIASEDFSEVTQKVVTDLNPIKGFSAFKFVPGTNDEVIVALKTEEVNNKISSYITAFNHVTGHTLLVDQFFSTIKFEGIEFV